MAAVKGFDALLRRPEASSPKRKTSPASQPSPKRPVLSMNQHVRRTPPSRPSSAPLKPQSISYSECSSLKVKVNRLPDDYGTWEMYQTFSAYGSVDRLEIFEARGSSCRNGYVIFRPPPENTSWIHRGIELTKDDGTRQRLGFNVQGEDTRGQFTAQKSGALPAAEYFKLPVRPLESGVMKEQSEMATLFAVAEAELLVNLKFKRLEIKFTIGLPSANATSAEGNIKPESSYKISADFNQIQTIHKFESQGRETLVLQLAAPPCLYRQTTNIESTHDHRVLAWNESQTWYRATGIDLTAETVHAYTKLRKEAPVLDIGRWLTCRLTLDESPEFDKLGQTLIENNVSITRGATINVAAWTSNFSQQCSGGDGEMQLHSNSSEKKGLPEMQQADCGLWAWAGVTGSSALHAIADPCASLAFEVRYQLEVCLSNGMLHECNISPDLLLKMATLEPIRATKLLEKVADEKQRFYEPMGIFRLLSQVSVVTRKVPRYCAMIRAAVITPSTIYFASPVLETSNRILRKYSEFEDRFLRVKFTDERYKGRVMGGDDKVNNEIFTRVKRTMQNGIMVGDRHYEFLAFGNSQFRENGAYFFAATGGISAAFIREKMGDFEKYRDIDRNVAKYASRLGQCFSTTRGMSVGVRIEPIGDIERNGFTFTDGVGKISPFLAQMIAEELGLPNAANDYPSVFQFRLGGCKGVLAVDPALKGQVVQIRPSQEKFPARYHGLEICRYSQLTSAYLNVQIILVLNALGVKEEVFVAKMKEALAEIRVAMKDQNRAIELLSRNIDYNRMTLKLAEMIFDGFMSKQDPFMLSVLRLWRSWMIKYLKEKARIFVNDGAFVFGCIDETATLRGHFESDKTVDDDERRDEEGTSRMESAILPEIFLQIPDPDIKGSNKPYKVIQGICTLARNPSLHPGDARVVRAVDVPALHHLKNCVVIPQTGDRDLANMCSGGDLDGDDYLVMWDKDLLPKEVNYPPMDYDAPEPIRSDGAVTLDDITSFFVTHMKNDSVGRIAMAHRYLADDSQDGVKDPKCLELAQLHSMAVDYAKTGVPAKLPKRLMTKRWPHWAERKSGNSYRSNKVLGKLYDEVQRVPFIPAWDMAFDARILNAYQLDEQILQDAQEVKQLYDEAVRRIMTQHGIQSEFEVWTTFVLEHSQDENDYKFAEKLGETVSALKQHHQELCYEKAGTTPQQREWTKMGPFIAAMYTVTANEVTATYAANGKTELRGGQNVPVRTSNFSNMPFMSFPWIFGRELGQIATRRSPGSMAALPYTTTLPSRPAQKKHNIDVLGDFDLAPLQDITTVEGVVHEGDLLDVYHQAEDHAAASTLEQGTMMTPDSTAVVTDGAGLTSERSMEYSGGKGSPPSEKVEAVEGPTSDALRVPHDDHKINHAQPDSQETGASDADDEDEAEVEEEVTLCDEEDGSTLDALSRLVGF